MNKEDPFDMEPNGLNTFMSRLVDRANDLQLTGTNWIGMVPNATGALANIFENYGTREMDEVEAWERTYLNTISRNAQDSKILYDLIMGSITVKSQQRLSVPKSVYNLTFQVAIPNQPETEVTLQAGLCLLKLITIRGGNKNHAELKVN